jgi:hypothetical protein
MCDYSLEMYRSRPAQLGERYETHQFQSYSIGFIAAMWLKKSGKILSKTFSTSRRGLLIGFWNNPTYFNFDIAKIDGAYSKSSLRRKP